MILPGMDSTCWVERSKETPRLSLHALPFLQMGFLDGDKLKVPGLCALNGSKRDRRIEGGEPSLIRKRECEQMNVRKLATALDMLPSKAGRLPAHSPNPSRRRAARRSRKFAVEPQRPPR